MRKEHVEYYTTKVFHEWFRKISGHMGDSPFQAVIQNFVYYPDAKETSKSRLEVFVKGLIQFIKQLEEMSDDNIRLKSLEIKGVYVDDTDFGGVSHGSGASEPVTEELSVRRDETRAVDHVPV